MSKATRIAICLALLLLPAVICGATETDRLEIRLREDTSLTGEVIRLKDVAALPDSAPQELGELALGNAPWPGQGREISRVLVKVRLVSAGQQLKDFRFTGADSCIVRVKSLRVEPERITRAARQHLMSQFPEGGPEVSAELVRDVQPVTVTAGEGEVELQPTLYGSGAPVGNVRVDVDVVRNGRRLQRVPVSFRARLFGAAAVARRRIARGEALSEANCVVTRRETTGAHGRCLRSMHEVKGKVAARTIQPGQVLTERLVRQKEEPVVIERSQRVFLVVESRTLRIVTLGEALDRARRGELARARNLKTGREVVGVAMAGGVIKVPLGGPDHES
ncbi:MAG: flagellar basal body P-ring formation chaperone FlgA [Candidatus Brocadiia bacterium]